MVISTGYCKFDRRFFPIVYIFKKICFVGIKIAYSDLLKILMVLKVKSYGIGSKCPVLCYIM